MEQRKRSGRSGTAAAFGKGCTDLFDQFRDEPGILPGIDRDHDRGFVAEWRVRPDVAPERSSVRKKRYAEPTLDGDEHIVEAAA